MFVSTSPQLYSLLSFVDVVSLRAGQYTNELDPADPLRHTFTTKATSLLVNQHRCARASRRAAPSVQLWSRCASEIGFRPAVCAIRQSCYLFLHPRQTVFVRNRLWGRFC